MSKSTTLAFTLVSALALCLASPVVAQEAAAPVVHHHRHHHHHYAAHEAHYHSHVHHHYAAPAATVVAPVAAPAAPAVDDSDGLSRDGEDCNMGCIDETN